jgi:uncharacterized membrane protein (UPF0127 family)
MFSLSTQHCNLCSIRNIIVWLSFILINLSVKTMACPLGLPVGAISIKGHTLTAEIAVTASARQCGLSHRDDLPENHGMLFIFPVLRHREFWMKDTRIPLSLAFLDKSGQILNIQKMTPMQIHEQYPSLHPVRYALEVNQGWFKKHGIEVGDIVEMNLPLALDVK